MIQWWDVTSKRVLFERIALAYGTGYFITESRFEDFVALQLAVFSKLQMRTVSVPGTHMHTYIILNLYTVNVYGTSQFAWSEDERIGRQTFFPSYVAEYSYIDIYIV